MATNWDRKSGITDPHANNTKVLQNIKMKLTSAPTLTLVTKAEAKNYLKLGTDTTDDDLVDDLISASQGVIERELGGLALVPQTWKQYQKGGIETIELLKQPLIGTPTVSYYSDFDTVTATNITVTTYFRAVENELFHVDGYFEEGRDGDGYAIEYEAGYFTASNYTSSTDTALNAFKTAILRTCAWLYEQREEGITGIKEENWSVTYQNGELPEGIKRLIMPYHTGKGLI